MVPDSIPSPKEELAMLKSMTFDELVDKAANSLVTFAINLTIAIIVFYAGKFIIGKIHGLVAKVMLRRNVDKSLTTFILSLIRMTLYFLLIVTVIGILGIETSSFIALFASAGVAIGMALSGTLQNFAGGVLILFLKPYKVGDYIEAQGFAGTVKEIQIFHTVITTIDNKQIIIPNGGLSTGSINNYSREEYRRVDWVVGMSYGDDMDVARGAILGILDSDERIVKQYIEDDRKSRVKAQDELLHDSMVELPYEEHGWVYRMIHRGKKSNRMRILQKFKPKNEVIRFEQKVDRSPVVYLQTMADSSVNLTVRAWTRNEFYWPVYYAINERFYKELPAAGVRFPFPQLDVHLDK
ncbi:MAG: mechanosensitive ion channel [Clostridium sp.]|nr:mechanosensitive ion channel [Clostridium sp.]